MGYAGRPGAYKAVIRGLEAAAPETAELRMLHVQRCEELIARLWPLAIGDPPDLEAIDRLMRVLAHQARVTGLYVPDRSQLTITATSTGTGTHPK